MERTFQLKVRTVLFVVGLLGQNKGLSAPHRIITTWIIEESRNLLDGQIALRIHGTSASGTMWQPGEAFIAHKMAFDALLHRRSDMVQAHRTFKKLEQVLVLDVAQGDAVGIGKNVHFDAPMICNTIGTLLSYEIIIGNSFARSSDDT